jgi:N-methylhydantoinase A/oxoprolinase/acetone carboxylase beta subunit
MLWVGIDVGGTFTDAVTYDQAKATFAFAKVPSTPDDPTRAVLDVLTAMKAESEIATTRAFAMTATAQCREARARHGRGRYSLCTGDVGLAVYLRDCMSGEPLFPTVDVF